MPSISPCSIRRSVASSTSRARAIRSATRLFLMLSRVVGAAWMVMAGLRAWQVLADRLVEGKRAMATRSPIRPIMTASSAACGVPSRRRRPGDGRYPPGTAGAFQDRMGGDEPTLIEDADLVGELVDLDDTPRPVGNAVVVAADRDQPVMADAALELEQRVEGEGRQGLQFGLLGGEGFRDDPLGGAVQPDIGDRRKPVVELGVEIVEIAEGAAEEEVLADVAEWPLDLALYPA